MVLGFCWFWWFWRFGLISAMLAGLNCSATTQAAPTERAGAAALLAPEADTGADTGADTRADPRADARADGADPLFEPARVSVRATTEWLARGVDSWFGNKPFSEGGKISDGRLSVFLLTRQHETPDLSVRFNARVWLPNLQDRAYLFLGRDDERETVTDQPDAFSRQQRLLRETNAEPSFFAGLGFLLHESVQFRLGLRGGLKPYAHARYGKAWQLSSADQLDVRETVFWTPDDHLGSTTALAYEHAWSPTLMLRWLNAATITQDSQQFDWSSSLGAYRSLGDQRLLSLEVLFSGREGSGVPLTDFGVQAKWEQPVHKDWLLGEVLIGHFWPRPDARAARSRAWAVGAGVKMKF
jgi:hypothetical protein